METLRTRRLLEEREIQVKERLQELKESILDHFVQLPKTASMDCRPTASILLGEKECFDLVMAPREQEVTRPHFARVLPEVCSRWEAWCEDQLRSSVRTAIPSIPGDIDPLRLAVAVFDCEGVPYSGRTCSGSAPHRYPSLMAHACLCAHPWARRQEEEDSHISCIAEWLSKIKTNDNKRYRPRSRTKIHQSKCIPLDSIVRMQHIVSSLGLDPTRTMHEQISDVWLWCRVCSPSSKEVFTWEAAVRLSLPSQWGGSLGFTARRPTTVPPRARKPPQRARLLGKGQRGRHGDHTAAQREGRFVTPGQA